MTVLTASILQHTDRSLTEIHTRHGGGVGMRWDALSHKVDRLM